MTVYRPAHEDWHDDLPGECTCDEAWAGRGMVDDKCWFHRMVDVVGELKMHGWKVSPQ